MQAELYGRDPWHLGVLDLIVPALLRKGPRVAHAVGVQHRIEIDIHQVVKVLHMITYVSVRSVTVT